MRDFIEIALGIVIAFIFYTVLAKISISLIQIFNVFSLVIIYFALDKGEIYGACIGTFCGLIQDSFSLGVFGVAGIAQTIMGFTAGYISRKINVLPLRRNFFFIFVLVGFELLLWALLYSFIFSETINTGKGLIFFQPLSTALLGSILFILIRKFKNLASKQSK